MNIAMIGTGYVGLVSGACLSEFGHKVTCVDKDSAKIAKLRATKIPIFEPGLEELVGSNAKAGRLMFDTDLADAVQGADAIFIAVGTPQRRGDGQAEMRFVFDAAREAATALARKAIVITKSTVPVGTSRRVESVMRSIRPDLSFDVASNPEFLREGSAIEDFLRPDRIVVGCDTEQAREILREIYRPLYLNETPILFTTRETAELIKYAANAFLATKIAFINEMADICDSVGADVQDLSRAIGMDRRIGSKFLHPGPGFGGSCFPKDTRALASTGQAVGAPSRIVGAVIASNEMRKHAMTEKIVGAFGSLPGKTVAVLGLTFKPNTDDMREAASLTIIPELRERGANIQAFDPSHPDMAAKELGVNLCTDPYSALDGADGVVILTEWNEFRALDLSRAKQILRAPLMVDLRNIYDPDIMREAGFRYISVGRAPVGVPTERLQTEWLIHRKSDNDGATSGTGARRALEGCQRQIRDRDSVRGNPFADGPIS